MCHFCFKSSMKIKPSDLLIVTELPDKLFYRDSFLVCQAMPLCRESACVYQDVGISYMQKQKVRKTQLGVLDSSFA